MDKFAKSLFVCVGGGMAKYQPFDEDSDGCEVVAKAREDVTTASASSVPYSCEQCGHRGSVAAAAVAQSKVSTEDKLRPIDDRLGKFWAFIVFQS